MYTRGCGACTMLRMNNYSRICRWVRDVRLNGCLFGLVASPESSPKVLSASLRAKDQTFSYQQSRVTVRFTSCYLAEIFAGASCAYPNKANAQPMCDSSEIPYFRCFLATSRARLKISPRFFAQSAPMSYYSLNLHFPPSSSLFYASLC